MIRCNYAITAMFPHIRVFVSFMIVLHAINDNNNVFERQSGAT